MKQCTRPAEDALVGVTCRSKIHMDGGSSVSQQNIA